MTWKSGRKYHGPKNGMHNSEYDSFLNTAQNPRIPLPAISAEEGLWRAAKRLSAAYSWLSLDLALLAELPENEDVLDSVAASLQTLGSRLLPQLGVEPIDPKELRKPDVVDLVGTLSSLVPKGNKTCDAGVDTSTLKTQKAEDTSSNVTCGCQTSGDYITRRRCSELVGHWVPLSTCTLRRGSSIRCVKKVTTDNAEGSNIQFTVGDLAKVLAIDSDGDARVAALGDLGFADLWQASHPFWLLHERYKAFEVWRPISTDSEESDLIRKSRARAETDGFE